MYNKQTPEKNTQGANQMKEFRLSTPGERLVSIAFSVLVILGLGGLLFLLRSNLGLLIVCGLAAGLLALLFGVYIYNVLRTVCIVDPEKKQLTYKGINGKVFDLTSAVQLQTLPKRNGQTAIRTLVFSDEDDMIVAVIPTMFTYKQGMMAEPMAEEMAKVLGIRFKRNIPEWEFDKELYKQHIKEEAERQKAESKARRKAKMNHRINKYKNAK